MHACNSQIDSRCGNAEWKRRWYLADADGLSSSFHMLPYASLLQLAPHAPYPTLPLSFANAASSAHFIIHYQVSEIRFHFPLVPLPPYKYFVAVLSAHH